MAKESNATTPDVTPAAPVQMDQSTLLRMIEEMKKPYVDPDQAARKQRDRERLRAERERQESLRQAAQDACPHMREDNTSAIAWMTNSDGITRGVCQRCNALFTPEHPRYMQLIRIPVRSGNVIF
jgi:hypothetical protein